MYLEFLMAYPDRWVEYKNVSSLSSGIAIARERIPVTGLRYRVVTFNEGKTIVLWHSKEAEAASEPSD